MYVNYLIMIKLIFRVRVQNVPIPLKHVPEADRGLWGGEAFIVGLRKKNDNPMKPRLA